MAKRIKASDEIFRYFKKADSQFKIKMVKALNWLQKTEIEKLQKTRRIKEENGVHYYRIDSKTLMVFIVVREDIYIIDYVFEKDGEIYSIKYKGNPFKLVEKKEEQAT